MSSWDPGKYRASRPAVRQIWSNPPLDFGPAFVLGDDLDFVEDDFVERRLDSEAVPRVFIGVQMPGGVGQVLQRTAPDGRRRLPGSNWRPAVR